MQESHIPGKWILVSRLREARAPSSLWTDASAGEGRPGQDIAFSSHPVSLGMRFGLNNG
jgi:hypothetical protein